MRLQKKSLSRISLTDLLRRRRTSLENFLNDMGIVTYELLKSRCASMGVNPPSEEQFLKAKGTSGTHDISSPTEGIVVLNPPPPEEGGQEILESDPSAETTLLATEAAQPRKKRQKRSTETQ